MKKYIPFYSLRVEIHVKLEQILNVDLKQGYLDTYIHSNSFRRLRIYYENIYN